MRIRADPDPKHCSTVLMTPSLNLDSAASDSTMSLTLCGTRYQCDFCYSPRNFFNTLLEPLHKNVLTYESCVQLSQNYENSFGNFHKTLSLNWIIKPLNILIPNILFQLCGINDNPGVYCTREYLGKSCDTVPLKFKHYNTEVLLCSCDLFLCVWLGEELELCNGPSLETLGDPGKMTCRAAVTNGQTQPTDLLVKVRSYLVSLILTM